MKNTAGVISRNLYLALMVLLLFSPRRVVAQASDLEQRVRELEDTVRMLQAMPASASDKAPSSDAKSDDAKSDDAKSDDAKSGDAKTFTVGKNLKMEASWNNGLWFESPDKAFRFNAGGVINFDMGWYGASQNIVNSIGEFNNFTDPKLALSDGMNLRRARVRFSGSMWEQFVFNAQYDFAQSLDLRPDTLAKTDIEPVEATTFTEIYVGMVNLPFLGQIRVGRQRENLNFVNATSGANVPWLERPLPFEAFDNDVNYSNGVTVQNGILDDRVHFYGGFFQNNNREFSAIGDGEYAYDARVTALPIWDEDGETWVHVGADYSYRVLHRDRVRFFARPPIRNGNGFQVPNVLKTPTIFSRNPQQLANLEFVAAVGQWTIGAEASYTWVTNSYTGGLPVDGKLPKDAKSHGTFFAESAYVEVLYFLTPDHRGYVKERPGYGRIVPRRNFYLLRGEEGQLLSSLGGWEVGLRYDYLDLISNGVNGGIGQAATAAINWYLNANCRIQANYFWMHREFDPSDTKGRATGPLQGFGLRFSCDF